MQSQNKLRRGKRSGKQSPLAGFSRTNTKVLAKNLEIKFCTQEYQETSCQNKPASHFSFLAQAEPCRALSHSLAQFQPGHILYRFKTLKLNYTRKNNPSLTYRPQLI